MRSSDPKATALWALALLLLPALAVPSAQAQDDPQEITLELIMSDPDWLGNAPQRPYWADDGGSVYFEQKRPGEDESDLVHMDLDGTRTVVADQDRGAAGVGGGDWSHDRRYRVYSREGDVYVKDVLQGTIRQLTRTAAAESEPIFLTDGRVAFHRGDAIFVRDLESGLEVQAADLQLEKDPAEAEEKSGYLAEQQPRLIQWVRVQKEKKEARRVRRDEAQEADPLRADLPFYLGDDVQIVSSNLSPSGDWMLVTVRPKKHDRGRRDQMPNYISEDGYVAVEDVRPKVGTGDDTGLTLLLLDLARHQRHELGFAGLPGITDDPLAEIRRHNEERKKAAEGEDEDEDEDEERGEEDEGEDEEPEPREVFVWRTSFSPDGRYAAVLIRSMDNKDRWIALVERPAADEETPELSPLHHLFDEAWINWSFNDFGWLSDSRRAYFLSEESGWSQLYLHDTADGSTRRLTEGDHVVRDPEPSFDDRYVYFAANPEHPGIYESFRVELGSSKVERLTSLGGRNEARLSPDGKNLLVTHSTTTEPPELYVQEARPGVTARQLTRTVSDAFAALPWVAPETAEVPSSHHDRPIYARFYPATGPRTEDAGGKRAAVVFVHGAGYLQNSHQGWSGYFREFMFHTLLTQHGYTVLDMDYRASAGYGRDWRTAIYRQMGTPEVEDLKDGVAWLAENHGVDPRRVGVYGGSYGGFLTFMALFTEPELFACGAALRPVTDWAHYNHPYTSNILNTPDVDAEAYERSSPIEFAEGLTRPLLMCSGMQDDNVFFQDTVRLVQRLIELGKQDWELAVYPIEHHGFREPSSWLDEYRRIFKLFETHLRP